MNTGPITYDEVARAAIQILREGKNVTKPLVRERLGNRGSHGTIQKHLEAWRESLKSSDIEVLPPGLPESLSPHIEAFWNAAVALSEASLEDEWAKTTARVQEANGRVAIAEEERQQWMDYARERDADLALKVAEIGQYEERLRAAEDRLRMRDIEYQGLLDRLDARERAAAEERETHARQIASIESRNDEANKLAELRWETEREKLVEQAKAAMERAELEVRRSDQHEVYFLNEVAKARDDVEKERARGAREIERLEQELTIARRRDEANAQNLGRMEDRLMASQTENDELETHVQGLQRQLATMETESADLKAQLETMRRELVAREQVHGEPPESPGNQAGE